jgi:hypothetical protein
MMKERWQMAKKILPHRPNSPDGQKPDASIGAPRSLDIASRGVSTGGQFAGLMSALMSDLIDGRITPSVGNAVCNAGGKLLKVVEMQQRWGTSRRDGGPKDLMLSQSAKAS